MPGIRSNIYTLWGNNIPWMVWNCLNCIDRTQKTLYVFTGVKWHKMEPLYLRIYGCSDWGRWCTSVCNCIHSIAVKSLSFTLFLIKSPLHIHRKFPRMKNWVVILWMSGFLCQSLLNFGRVFLCHKKRAVWFEVGPICSFFVNCKPIRLNLPCHTPKSKVFDKLCGQNAKDWLLGRRRRGKGYENPI